MCDSLGMAHPHHAPARAFVQPQPQPQPRTIAVPPALLAECRAALETYGPRRGAERLGVSRNALMGLIATGRGMPGTVALLRENSGKVAA